MLISLLLLEGCSGGGPDYSAAVCLEDFDQRHLIEDDVIAFLERHNLTDRDMGVDVAASRFLGPKISVNHPGKWEPGHAMLIVGTATTNGDDKFRAEFKQLFEEKWGGFPISTRGYRHDLCDQPRE